MSLKVNINKIHSDLTSVFGEVKISEGSSLEFGEFVEMSIISEGKEVSAIISKRELENDKFNWKYYSNPKSKEFLVERTSSKFDFINDVKDILEKNRFDSEYINTIQ